ncbi:hypothetical protein Gpo141_00000463 [Globisporangium polare]
MMTAGPGASQVVPSEDHVCIMTPLPALVISILIELFIMIMAMTMQVKVITPELPFTTTKCLTISFISSSIYVAVAFPRG